MPARNVLLLVDDDDVARSMLAAVLSTTGIEVVEAADGPRALQLADSRRPDVMVLDVGLPGMDGFEVCRRMRGDPALSDLPILVLTGRNDPEAIAEAFRSGATDFSTKAAAPALITHRVQFLLRAHLAVGELRRSEARLAEAQRIARVGNWEVEMRSGAFLGSAEALRLFGVGTSAGLQPLGAIRGALAEDERAAFDQLLAESLADGAPPFEREFRLEAPDVRGRILQINGEAYRGRANESRIQGTVQDVTESVTSREQIRTLAYQDSLTGLPNRLQFVEQVRSQLALARRRRQQVAIMVVDLDNFKRINDTLGHGAGDEVLRAVGSRLRDAVREYDAITRDGDGGWESSVARMGGDEFLLSVVDLTTGEEAATVGRRLLEAIGRPIPLPSGALQVSASIGISIFPEDGDSFEVLLKHADVALYQAKDAGRNAYEFYDHRMSEAALQRMVLESSLRAAIANGELAVAIQPKVDGRTGRLVGGEALLRWRHEQFGPIAPSVFVTLAERIGLATPLTRFVVEEVARLLARWQSEGLSPFPIAVNVSPQVFRDPEAVNAICRLPLAYGVSPSLIEFEVTETALIDDPQRAEAVLDQLHHHGYRIALDDFGTGYSSLSHLRRFHLDAIKIDRSFVRDILEDARDAAIVRATVGLAESLGLDAVAEGVENEAQREALLGLGCGLMQGYLFGKPVPPEEYAALVRDNQPLARVG